VILIPAMVMAGEPSSTKLLRAAKVFIFPPGFSEIEKGQGFCSFTATSRVEMFSCHRGVQSFQRLNFFFKYSCRYSCSSIAESHGTT
jgi:hypothetical protein